MTSFLAFADHFGNAIHGIGMLLAGISVGFIVTEALKRTYGHFVVKPRNEQRLRDRCELMISRLQRRRAF